MKAIGVDVGGTKSAFGLIESGKIIKKIVIETDLNIDNFLSNVASLQCLALRSG